MAEVTPEKMMTFAQFQAEMRRKILQQASTPEPGDRNRNSAKLWQSPSTSNISFDSSYGTPTVQTNLRADKEIVSSSNNMRNMYSKMQHEKGNQEKFVTSSVNGMDTESKDQKDRLAMPPPKFHSHLPQRKSCSRSLHDSLSNQDEHIPSDIKYDSSKKKCNYKYPSREGHPEAFSPVYTDSFEQNRRARTFENWTVALNERRELIIKGTLECGRLARSKPILTRLTSKSLESVYKHLYHLQGNLVDNEQDLPEYVRGKFYNGFPDDWENVCEIWKTYVAKGSSVTFRWPTPITDSDDDLKSEVTDITFADLKSPEKDVHDTDSSRELNKPQSKSINKTLRTKNKPNVDSRDYLKRDSFTQTPISYVAAQRDKRFSLDNFIHDDKENINVDSSRASAAASKLLNSVNVIVNNLLQNKQSVACIDKFATMLEFFSTFMLNGSINESDTFKADWKSVGEPNSLNLTYNFTEPAHSSRNTTVNKEIAECDSSPQRKRTFSTAIGDDNDSDNEMYSGVNKIRLSQVIRQKETLLKPSKRKIRKQDVAENSTIKIAEDDKKHRHAESDDSSVSIIHETSDHLRVSSNIRMKLSKELTRDKNAYETIEDSIDKNSSELISRSNRDKCPIMPRKNINRTMEMNSNESNKDGLNDSFLERSGKSLNSPRLQEILKKMTAKPEILNAISAGIKSAQRNYLSRDGKENLFEDTKNITFVDKAAKSGRKNLIPIKSPLKSGNNKEKSRLFSSDGSDNNDDDDEHTEKVKVPKTNDIDAIASNKFLDENNVTVPMDNNDSSTAKRLSAWIPRVIECGTDVHLIFEGKLVNEAGHVISRQFKTDAILRRISMRLVETVHHEFYQLIGALGAKNDIPKDLLSRCRQGCPTKIKQFCKAWKLLQKDTATTARNILDSSQNSADVTLNSRGRRIISPRNYWEGEGTTAKGDLKNDFQNSVDHARKQKKDNNNETQDTTARSSPDKFGKNTSKQKRVESSVSGSNKSIAMAKYRDITYSYKRIPMISREDDISCDDQASHV